MPPEGSDGYPFHTAVLDGREVAGILFNPRDGEFYEFQDPETHDDYERYEDPRTGKVLTFDGNLQRLMAQVRSGHVRAPVEAEEWAEFREGYIGAEQADYEAWRERWEAMADLDGPRGPRPGRVECGECGQPVTYDAPEPECPACGSTVDASTALD